MGDGTFAHNSYSSLLGKESTIAIEPQETQSLALLSRQNYLVAALQWTIYPILLLLRYVFVRTALQRHEALIKSEAWQYDLTYVVYANHQSALDALIIPAALPLAALRCLLPLRFFTANKLLKGMAGSFLTSMGCFPAKEHDNRPFGLDYAFMLMESGCSLVIFPTGRRTREQGKARRGVAALAADPSVRLLPVYLNWRNRWSCELLIGAPFQAAAGATADELMERVYQLPAGFVKE